MTIQDASDNFRPYTDNGDPSFTVDFPFEVKEDLEVKYVSADGSFVYWNPATDFTITGTPLAGTGELVPDAGVSRDDPGEAEIQIQRVTLSKQGTPFNNSQTIRNSVVEAAFDYVTRLAADAFSFAKRSIRVPFGEPGLVLAKAADRGDRIVTFSADGAQIVLLLKDDFKGDQGDPVSMRVSGGQIQYRIEAAGLGAEDGWEDVIALSALTGAAGVSVTNVTHVHNPDDTLTFTFHFSDASTAQFTTGSLIGPVGTTQIDASGTLAGRSAYDAEARGFVYYADDTQLLYQKQSNTSGDWSVGLATFGSSVGISDIAGLQAALDSKLPIAGGTMTGALTLSADPSAPLQPATKQYVDQLAKGLARLDPILSIEDTPPGSPVLGDRHLVGESPTGDFVTHEDEVAEWDGSAWEYTIPDEGDVVFHNGVGFKVDYRYMGGTWVSDTSTQNHQALIGAGSYDHAAIDAHIDDAAKHREINDAGTAATDLWSAQHIDSQIDGAGEISPASDAYTLVLTDRRKLVVMDRAAANTVTVPPDSSVNFPVKTFIHIKSAGAGQTSIVAGAGVTIESAGGKLKLTEQFSGATLVKRGADKWWLVGDLVA